MSAQIYCPAMTYPGSRYEPKEYCDEIVSEEGDFCELHDTEDRDDADYENYLESLRKES